jgi:excisionase family DNA binding protein
MTEKAALKPKAELSPRQAAAMLQVSRPHLNQLLDAGSIPSRKVGTRRRIRFEDLVAYLERERARRREVMESLVEETERLGLY